MNTLYEMTSYNKKIKLKEEKEVCHQEEAETAEPDGRSAIQTKFGW